MARCRTTAELELERGARRQAEGVVADLRAQLESVWAAEEAARSAAQRTLAVLQEEVFAVKVRSGGVPPVPAPSHTFSYLLTPSGGAL